MSNTPGAIPEQKPMHGVKVCFLSTIPVRTSRLFSRQCEATAEAGADTTLICPFESKSRDTGLRVRRYPTIRGPIGRLLSTPAILGSALAEKADLYHVHTVQLIPVAILLKVLFRKRVVYDMFEDFPSMVMTRKKLPLWMRELLRRIIYRVEAYACKTLDGVVTADPGVLRLYAREYRRGNGSSRRDGSSRMVFYNFPGRLFSTQVPNEIERPNRPFDIVYSGGISERTGMCVLLDAVEWMVRDGYRPRVLIFGYVDNPKFLEDFRARAAEKGIADCFELKGRVLPEEVPGLVAQAKVGVVPLQPIPKFLKNIPTKMFEYWACGLPVVASNLPPIRLFFREGEYGHMVDPRDARQFADGLLRLLRDPVRTDRMGQAAREAVWRRMNSKGEERRLFRLYLALAERH